ncbi:MAG TPA: hypothetical protein VKA53_08920 [Thermoanaerobaculia bacterium]|nr:hypothetical protein [Thermoanaerobaculia bacterium]
MTQSREKLVIAVLFMAALGAMLLLPGEARTKDEPGHAKLEVTFYYLPG